MKTILLTGADGQLGSEIKHTAGQYTDFRFLYTDVKDLDITKLSDVKAFYEKNKFDCIINCAAYTNVDKAESDEANAFNINANAVKNLAEISNENEIPLIHISTDYVFDGENGIPYKENDATNPKSVYGRTKLSGEKYAATAFRYMIIRTAWLYSVYGHNFVKTMLRLGEEKDTINVVADQVGSPTNAEDLALAIFKILKTVFDQPETDFSGIYHFSDEGSCSWFEFAKEIMSKGKRNCIVNPVTSEKYPTPVKRPKFSLLNKEKITKTFGLKIPHWKESLKKCLIRMN